MHNAGNVLDRCRRAIVFLNAASCLRMRGSVNGSSHTGVILSHSAQAANGCVQRPRPPARVTWPGPYGTAQRGRNGDGLGTRARHRATRGAQGWRRQRFLTLLPPCLSRYPAVPPRSSSPPAGHRAPSNVMILSMIALVLGCDNRFCSSNAAFRGGEMARQ